MTSIRIFAQKIGLFSLITALSGHNPTHANDITSKDALGFSFTTIEGETLSLEQFRGNAILIVNTASRCGFTKQYDGLQHLWDSYREQGLVVIGVPSNDFGGQEPLANDEIKTFCEVNYNITFPMMEKVPVKGEEAHPFYRFAREQFGFRGAPKWNFHKYLIAPDGQLVDWFSSITAPDADKLLTAIERILPNNYEPSHADAEE